MFKGLLTTAVVGSAAVAGVMLYPRVRGFVHAFVVLRRVDISSVIQPKKAG